MRHERSDGEGSPRPDDEAAHGLSQRDAPLNQEEAGIPQQAFANGGGPRDEVAGPARDEHRQLPGEHDGSDEPYGGSEVGPEGCRARP